MHTTSVSQGRRLRKTQRTRHHIGQTAIRLFADKGFNATTIDEIVEAADYSTSTFFRLFADKEEVVFYDFDTKLEELQSLFGESSGESNWVTVRLVFIRFARLWDEDGDMGIVRAKLFHDEPTLRSRYLAKNHQWELTIAQRFSREFGNPQAGCLRAHLLAGIAVAAFRSAWHAQLLHGNLSLEESVTQAFEQLTQLNVFAKE